MIYHEMPKNFKPKFEAVGIFVQCNGEIVLLHRQNHKPQGNTWGIPSGKVNIGEDPKTTAIRETKEETGFIINEGEMNFFKTVFVGFVDYEFIYHIYHTTLNNKLSIRINNSEHKAAKWISPLDALSLPFIEDLDGCIKLFFGI